MYPFWNGRQNVPADLPFYTWQPIGSPTTNIQHVLPGTASIQQPQYWNNYYCTGIGSPTAYPHYGVTSNASLYVAPATNYYIPFQANSENEVPLTQFESTEGEEPLLNTAHKNYFDKPRENIRNKQETRTKYTVQEGDGQDEKEFKRTVKYHVKEGYIVEEFLDSDTENETNNLSIERTGKEPKPLPNANIK